MNGKKITELKQERATVTNSIRSIMTEFEDKEMDATKKEEMTKIENRFDEINNLILGEEKQLNRERSIGEKANDDGKAKGEGKINEVQAAFKDYITTGSVDAFKVYNALQQDNPTQAGYLVPPEQFVNELIKELADATFMRQKARVLP